MIESLKEEGDFAKATRDRWDPSCPYLVAVSGGIDSMVLLRYLRDAGYQNLIAVHVDHGLRGAESKTDAAFVKSETRKLGMTCELHRVDVSTLTDKGGISIETAARSLRYKAFAETAIRRKCPRIFLAHHADDQVETVLMHFFRGSGSRGLAGMAEESNRRIDGCDLILIRPFLEVSRVAIEDFAKRKGLSWREDPSNQEDFALRNRIRKTLLPRIAEVFCRDVRAAVLRAASLAALDEAWVSEALGEFPLHRSGQGLEVAALRAFPAAKRNRLLLSWLRFSEVPDCGFTEVERCSRILLSEESPAKASLPGGHFVRRRSGVLFIERPVLD